MALTAFAPAKVNLYLHLIGRRPDRYHLLDSLIAFVDIGDRITAEPGGASVEAGGEVGAQPRAESAERLFADRQLPQHREQPQHRCGIARPTADPSSNGQIFLQMKRGTASQTSVLGK